MENMEKVTWRIWESPGIGRSLLIGGLLFYVPILNFLLLGYYGRWARRLILREGMDLPEWSEGRKILEELVRVIVPVVVWLAIPFALAGLLGWAISGLFHLLYLDIFAATVSWLPVALVALIAPPCLVASLIRLYRNNSIRESIDVHGVLHFTINRLRRCLFPMLQFYGILAVGWPLIGFAAFLATLPLLAQLILVMRPKDSGLQSPVF
ncbi:DUF4013 domain-containing protein [Puniceicoccales bacterium CK1056]|uniref:DUF4013 domain-containing protein n=1 Tax=Oceanipulchritudo coccoides TaxID=2706888 RepID=A0A6B2LZT1_9BACT|nr:DUF4013 domain-containing protein [Oceanipulchritudo coccoides]NDV62221.1 DUF4013 domain-containing protein [Oceanipulchritudo coccoides]